MMTKHTLLAAVTAFALLSACSGDAPTHDDAGTEAPAPVSSATPTASSAVSEPVADASTLRLEGLGDLLVGQAVPSGSSFAERGAQIEGSGCRVLSSPDYPDVYAIAEGGEVRRITVSRGSPVRLIEGIGPGSTKAEVLAAFPGFTEEPHKYLGDRGAYLTQPGDDPRLRFEIGEDGRVDHVHVGMQPQLTYVEGCA